MGKVIIGVAGRVLILAVGIAAIFLLNRMELTGTKALAGRLGERLQDLRVSAFGGAEGAQGPGGAPRGDVATGEGSVVLARGAGLVTLTAPGQATPGTGAPQMPANCEDPRPGPDALVVGDKIRLRFFETTEAGAVAAGSAGGGASPAPVAYERLDLSGIYDIGGDGTVSVPLLGRFDLVRQQLPCVEPMLQRAAYGFGSTGMRVSASFVQRPPIMARGALQAPGRYDYLPGMTVAQLMSLAGAISEDNLSEARLVASLEARRSELTRALASNALETARLTAALGEGGDDVAAPSPQLAAARSLLGAAREGAETRVLDAELRAVAAIEDRARIQADSLRIQLQEKRSYLVEMTAQVERLRERYAGIQSLQERGLVPLATLTETELNGMVIERRLLEMRAEITDLEARSRMADADLELQRADRRKALSAALQLAAKEADTLQGQLDGVEMQIRSEGGSRRPSDRLMVRIERPAPGGWSSIVAEASTLLQPGDLVTVVPPGDLAALADGGDPTRLALQDPGHPRTQ